jgi:hypothetical protein
MPIRGIFVAGCARANPAVITKTVVSTPRTIFLVMVFSPTIASVA